MRAGYGHFYGPGQFEDRIQPIENFIERRRVQNDRPPRQRARVSGRSRDLPQPALGPRLYARAARRVQHSVRRQRLAGAAGRRQPDRRLHRQQGQRHVPARRRQHVRQRHARAASPAVGQVDYKTSGCLDGLIINGNAIHGCGTRQLRRAADQRDPPLPLGPDRRPAVPVLAQQGHDAGIERGGDGAATRSTSTPSTAPTRATSRTRSTARSSTCCRSTGRWPAAGASAAS